MPVPPRLFTTTESRTDLDNCPRSRGKTEKRVLHNMSCTHSIRISKFVVVINTTRNIC